MVVATRPRARTKARQSENSIQRGIVNYLRATLSRARVFAIPNRAPRTASGRSINATPGLTPGIPDLQIVAPGGRCFFLEVKTDHGVLSDHQEEFLTWCALRGVPYAVVHNVDEVRAAIRSWNLESREVVA